MQKTSELLKDIPKDMQLKIKAAYTLQGDVRKLAKKYSEKYTEIVSPFDFVQGLVAYCFQLAMAHTGGDPVKAKLEIMDMIDNILKMMMQIDQDKLKTEK